MSALVPIEPAGDAVRTVLRPSLFRTETLHATRLAGATVAEIVAESVRDPVMRSMVQVEVQREDGTEDADAIPRSMWPHVRPKAGAVLTLVVVPQGGNSNIFRMVLMVAVTIAASVAFGPGGPVFGTGFLATVGSAIAITATPIAGPIALACLVNPHQRSKTATT